jgi:hypothetical protein
MADRRLTGRIVGPIRDGRGRIVSFWAFSANGHEPKYLFWKRRQGTSVGAFGLDLVYDSVAEGPSDLVLVEDLLDALLLQSRGLLNVAAIGGSAEELSAPRWQRLHHLGVRRVTLALKQDRAGVQATVAALTSAFRAEGAPEVFVLVPAVHAPLVIADSWRPYQTRGPSGAVLNGKRIHAYRYLALAILERHRPRLRWNEAARRTAWGDALALYESRRPSQTAELDAHFVPPVVEELGMPLNGQKPRDDGPTRAEEPKKTETAITRRPYGPRQDGFCRMHNCEQTDCFCFD